MELIFNELSLKPSVDNAQIANTLVEKLIKTYAQAKSKGFRKIRFHQVFEDIALLEGYTFLDWLNHTTNRNFKDLLLGARVYPFISEGDDWAEDEYFKRRYFFENDFMCFIQNLSSKIFIPCVFSFFRKPNQTTIYFICFFL